MILFAQWSAFQWILLSFIVLLLICELVSVFRGKVNRGLWTLRVGTWILIGLAISNPEHLTKAANTLGIERGADLVSYVGLVTFAIISLALYGRTVRLQRQITELSRHVAIRRAEPPAFNKPQGSDIGDSAPPEPTVAASADPPD